MIMSDSDINDNDDYDNKHDNGIYDGDDTLTHLLTGSHWHGWAHVSIPPLEQPHVD